MFNSSSQRSNGLLPSTVDHITKVSQTTYNLVNPVKDKESFTNAEKYADSMHDKHSMYRQNAKIGVNHIKTEIKIEPEELDLDFEDKIAVHSIIGLNNVKDVQNIPNKKGNIKNTHHETLERIDFFQDVYNHYQKHWFSASLEKFNLEERSREERIEITRHEFRRHLYQIMRSNLGQPNKFSRVSQKYLKPVKYKVRRSYQTGYDRLVMPRTCDIDNCFQPALPCTKHCTLHIMSTAEQVLFDYCTAKFADNTQCSVPVFDITHELPLCPEHARKRDNYRLFQEAKPKKLRKKVKPSAMIRPQKRNKKKKKPAKNAEAISAIIEHPIPEPTEDVVETVETKVELVEDMTVDQVLGLNVSDGLDQELGAQASHILEETDISNVLSTIQVEEFSDFFAVNRNGEYEPSREEAEELEKALAAVDNDVKSLEKLSQSQGLLDSLLDEQVLAEHLVQIPDVFHNGYSTCGDSMVAQTSSYLLPVEPHSHS